MARVTVGHVTKVRTFRSTPLSPYERGLEFGEQLREEVAVSAAAYRRLFEVRAERSFDVDRWSQAAWESIQGLAPLAAQEIAGIAEGAGRPAQEIAAINARTELLAIANPSALNECSTVVSLPAGKAPVAVQTWDWFDVLSDNWLHWTIPHPDGRVVETVTEVDMLGKIGVNGYGVGVLLNMLHHRDDEADLDQAWVGYPVHLLSRKIMDEAQDLEQARQIATGTPMSASTSLTLVQGDATGGRTVSVELFPGGHGLLEPDGDRLVRTNHFVAEAGAPGCLAETRGPGSRIRRDKLVTAFAERIPGTADEVIEAMDDHAEVGGICVHPDTSQSQDDWHATLATVSVDTAGHRLQVTAGGPCARDDA